MINTLKFGAITRMVFKNQPQIDWEKASKSHETLLAARAEDKQAWNQFNTAVDTHLKALADKHPGEPDYYAAAIASGPYGSNFGTLLVIDGKDLDQYAKDVFLEKQRFLSEFETRVSQPGIRTSDEKREQSPLPRTYNWGRPNNTGYRITYEDDGTRAESAVRRRYWDKATQTIDVTI